MSNVRIELDTPTSGRVFIDGVEMHGILSFRLEGEGGSSTHRLTLVLLPQTVEVTGLADVAAKHAKLGA